MSLALIAVGIVLDVGLGQLDRNVWNLPIYLDSVGTILAGALGGPLVGLVTGGVANLLWGLVFHDPAIMPYAITAACIGVATGVAAQFGAFRKPWYAALAGLIIGVIAALVSAPIAAYLLHGNTGSGSGEVLRRLSATGASVMQAATLQGFLSDPVDKTISFLIVWLVILVLPPWAKERLRRAEGERRPWQRLPPYGVAAVLSGASAAFSWFFLPAFGDDVYAVFYLAVILSALSGGGLGPALLAMAVGIGAQIAFPLGVPHGGLAVADALRIVIFVLVSSLIAFITNQRARVTAGLVSAQAGLEHALAHQRTQQAQVRSVVDNVVEGLMLISDDRVQRVNRRFEEIFSVTAPDVVGKTLEDLFPIVQKAFTEPAVVDQALRNTAEHQPDPRTNTFVRLGPQERRFELFSTPVASAAGTEDRLYGFRDVTHERQLESMKNQFVSQVSHELRTPLTAIKGFTDMLLDEDAGQLDEEQREYLGIIRTNVDRLAALINDLLDHSRIESGRLKLKFRNVELEPVLHEVVETLEPLVAKKRQTLSVEVAPGLPPARADRDRVVQILTNLVSNANKYTPDEGKIEIAAGVLDDQLQVCVKDNGFGIAPDDQAKLFTPFFRVDSTLTQGINGTGLGLSLVKSMVEMQGGKVTVETAPGQGSTFAFTLPAAERSIERPGVLVVDEKHNDADQLVEFLGNAGYTADSAGDVEDALQHLAQKRPDLVVLNVRIPSLVGFDAACRLEREAASREIPFLVLWIREPADEDLPAGPTTLNQAETLRRVREALGGVGQGRVLVVEDDRDIRRLLADTLRRNGIAVVEAPDGESGLEVAIREQPSLVLLDLRLPGIDGVAVLERLKRASETAGIPVIAMTGSEGLLLGARARVMALGAADFVTKPFELDSLVEEIRALIGAKEVAHADTSARR